MLEILKYPDPRLKKVSEPVVDFDADLHALLDAMAETMYGSNGVGLAAPQVDRPLRAFIIDILPVDEPKRELHEFINPTFSDPQGSQVYEEGCLSVPGFTAEIKRYDQITVNYFDRHGKSQSVRADGLLAVAIQHENDHLDGVLFVDRLSPLKRRLLKKKLAKAPLTL